MKLNMSKISELAEELDCGFMIYLNTETEEIKTILDSKFDIDEYWQKELDEIENNWNNFIRIKKPESYEDFKIMEKFINEVKDFQLKLSLKNTLQMKRPFAKFKSLIDQSEYRLKWFAFREKKYIEYLCEELKSNNIEIK